MEGCPSQPYLHPCGTEHKKFRNKPVTFTFTIEANLHKFIGFFCANPKTLGQYIKKTRLDKGLSTKVLADRVGCTPEIILEWEKDRCFPGIKLLHKLNKEFDIPTKLLKDAVYRKHVFKEKVNLSFDVDLIKGRLIECLAKAAKAGMRGRVKVFDD